MAGYSGTPLAKKLGFRPGDRVRIENAPENYDALVSPLPDGVTVSTRLRSAIDVCHLFVDRRKALAIRLPVIRDMITPDGTIWVSWPKKSSGVASDIVEGDIRSLALPIGLVDIKVCAIDEVWSGLKLVIRKELRR